MSEELWELESTNTGEQRVLSPKEREFLMTGDAGSYTTAAMEQRVTQKTEQIPDRFQELIDDISLLYYGDYLPDSGEDNVWEQLWELTYRTQQVRESSIQQPYTRNRQRECRFGVEIGCLLRLLQGEPISSEFVWGLIMGLVGESEADYNKEASNLVRLIEDLNALYESRLVTAGSAEPGKDGLEEERDAIRDGLRERGILPVSPLVHAILMEELESGSKFSLEPSFDISSQGERLTSDPREESKDEPPEPPDDYPSPDEMRQSKFDLLINRIINQTRLPEIDTLAKALREDTIRIQDKQWLGVEADSCFRVIAESDGAVHVQALPQTETQGQNNVTHALGLLASKQSDWVNYPIIENPEGDDYTWDLTEYGELLYEVKYNRQGSIDWIYNYIIESEDFHTRLDQLISKAIERV